MSTRLIGVCVLAYPRARRRRDGDYLRDLALELAQDHGVVRQALSLLLGGLRERVALRRTTFALAASVAVLGVASVVSVTLVGSSEREVEAHSCETRGSVGDGCAEIERLAASRERQGWDCTSRERLVDGRRLVDLECRTVS